MGRLLKEKEILPYTRGLGEAWRNASYNGLDKIALYKNWTFNSLAWDFSGLSHRLVKDDDFTKKSTSIAFLHPASADGRSGIWSLDNKFILPLWTLNEQFISNTTYNSTTTLFKPLYYAYCNKNTEYPSSVTTYNSNGTGTNVSVSDFVDSYNSTGCTFYGNLSNKVLGFKMYFLEYGNIYGYPLEPWEYLEYEADTDDFYDIAYTESDLIIGLSYFNKPYWPNNFSSYASSSSSLAGVNYYDARDTANATSPIDVTRRMTLDSDIFYTGNYDLMCIEFAVMDVTNPAFSYGTSYTTSGLLYIAADTETAIKPCISPLAPNVSPSAELQCCQRGKINITPYKIITNQPSKGYVNDYNLLYAFKSDYPTNSPRNHVVWGTANIYGLFYVIPLIADNPYVYYPTTDLFPLSNNNMGLYFHLGEAGSPLPTFYTV